MALIIEELNRARHVQARYRMDSDRMTVGRSFANDIILEDIHADANHLEIQKGEDGFFYLRDLDTVNGTQLICNVFDRTIKHGDIDERRVESGDEIQCGRTHLRISHEEAAVPPAVPLHSLEGFLEHLSHPGKSLALLAAVAGITLLTAYLGFAGSFEWTDAASLVLGGLVGLLVYAAAWAFIGRVVRHETRFFAHLAVACIGVLVYNSWDWISGFLGFNFSMKPLMPFLNFAVLAVILPAMLWCACYLALNLSSGWRWAAALILPLGFLGLGLAEDVADMGDFSEVPAISTDLMPKKFLLRQPVPMDNFLNESAGLFDIPLKQKKADQNKGKPAEQQAPGDTQPQNTPDEATETDS